MTKQAVSIQVQPEQYIKTANGKCVGNFLCVLQEEKPRRYHFHDGDGNTVTHGGDGNLIITVRVKEESLTLLKPRLISYLKGLLGRNKEELHTEGQKNFRGVMINLPDILNKLPSSLDFEVIVDVGCSSTYHQDEIAYEVMAALSGIPALKAVTPTGEYFSFIRQDEIDDGLCVKYHFERLGIDLEFSHGEELSAVVVSIDKYATVHNRNKFKKIMYDFVAQYVEKRTTKKLLHEDVFLRGQKNFFHRYQSEGSLKCVTVDIGFGKSTYFSVSVPYSRGFKEPFSRVKYAKRLMEMLSRAFKIPKAVEVLNGD